MELKINYKNVNEKVDHKKNKWIDKSQKMLLKINRKNVYEKINEQINNKKHKLSDKSQNINQYINQHINM